MMFYVLIYFCNKIPIVFKCSKKHHSVAVIYHIRLIDLICKSGSCESLWCVVHSLLSRLRFAWCRCCTAMSTWPHGPSWESRGSWCWISWWCLRQRKPRSWTLRRGAHLWPLRHAAISCHHAFQAFSSALQRTLGLNPGAVESAAWANSQWKSIFHSAGDNPQMPSCLRVHFFRRVPEWACDPARSSIRKKLLCVRARNPWLPKSSVARTYQSLFNSPIHFLCKGV